MSAITSDETDDTLTPPPSMTPWQLRLTNELGVEPLFSARPAATDAGMWVVRDCEDKWVCLCADEASAQIIADALNEVSK